METAEHSYFKEWDEELYELLATDKYVWVVGVHTANENMIYHVTFPHDFKRNGVIRHSFGSIYRWSIHILIARKGETIKYDTKASQRKNYHLKEQELSSIDLQGLLLVASDILAGVSVEIAYSFSEGTEEDWSIYDSITPA